MKFSRDRDLSSKAAELVRFDAESIKQVAAAEREPAPDIWLADPDQYEKNGRVLRDSSSPRMLAYAAATRTLYATDGCNSCARKLPKALKAFSEDELRTFAQENEIGLDFLRQLVAAYWRA